MKKATGMRSGTKLIENDKRILQYEKLTLWLLIVGAIMAAVIFLTGCAEVVREYPHLTI